MKDGKRQLKSAPKRGSKNRIPREAELPMTALETPLLPFSSETPLALYIYSRCRMALGDAKISLQMRPGFCISLAVDIGVWQVTSAE